MSDLIPNDGEKFILNIPEDRQRKEASQLSKKERNVLAELRQGLDEKIEQATSIFNIEISPGLSEDDVRVQLIAARRVYTELLAVRAWIDSVIEGVE